MRSTWLIEKESQNTQHCFWCGRPCGDRFLSSEFVADGFIGFSEVFDRWSKYICAGCVAMTDENDKSKRPRMFSWLITADRRESAHRGQMDVVRRWCLSPPPLECFAIILSVSGKKHLAFRSPVNERTDIITVQFEHEQVTYRPTELSARLQLCQRIAAASGKPALADYPSPQLFTRIAQYWHEFEPLLIWSHVWSEPLSRLAAWLCPKQEICEHDYPSDIAAAAKNVRRGGLATAASGIDRPGLFDTVG